MGVIYEIAVQFLTCRTNFDDSKMNFFGLFRMARNI